MPKSEQNGTANRRERIKKHKPLPIGWSHSDLVMVFAAYEREGLGGGWRELGWKVVVEDRLLPGTYAGRKSAFRAGRLFKWSVVEVEHGFSGSEASSASAS